MLTSNSFLANILLEAVLANVARGPQIQVSPQKLSPTDLAKQRPEVIYLTQDAPTPTGLGLLMANAAENEARNFPATSTPEDFFDLPSERSTFINGEEVRVDNINPLDNPTPRWIRAERESNEIEPFFTVDTSNSNDCGDPDCEACNASADEDEPDDATQDALVSNLYEQSMDELDDTIAEVEDLVDNSENVVASEYLDLALASLLAARANLSRAHRTQYN